jgi:hypothetical protein
VVSGVAAALFGESFSVLLLEVRYAMDYYDWGKRLLALAILDGAG